jgi:hypothetical protein
METFDPYVAAAGRELDAWIHFRVLKNGLSHEYPAYSSDERAACDLKQWVEDQFQIEIVVGRTELRTKRWFARYEFDPGNPTEVLAETEPLAICRLCALAAQRLPRVKRAHKRTA